MSKKHKKVLGIVLMSIPFILIIGFIAKGYGIVITTLAFAGVAGILALFFGGVVLLLKNQDA